MKVIINGDDFGKSEDINSAIIDAHKNGVLTTASLMVSGLSFDDAVRKAKENKELGVGLHLVFCRGKSVLSKNEIPDLVDEERNFTENPISAGLKYYFKKSLHNQLKKEMKAQIEKFISTGLKPDHINSHLNIHLHPTILNIMVELAGEYGIKNTRIVNEKFFENIKFDRKEIFKKFAGSYIFRILSLYAKRKLVKNGFSFSEKSYGLFYNGNFNKEYLFHIIKNLKEETTEIYFHPNKNSNDCQILLSDEIKEMIKGEKC